MRHARPRVDLVLEDVRDWSEAAQGRAKVPERLRPRVVGNADAEIEVRQLVPRATRHGAAELDEANSRVGPGDLEQPLEERLLAR